MYGLFNVRQDISVEFQVRQHLTSLVLQQGSLMKEGIIDEVIDDLDVQYHWSSILLLNWTMLQATSKVPF